MVMRDPFLLRMTFFGFGDARRALELIDEQIEMYEEHLARRRHSAPRWSRGDDPFVKLLAELGLNLNEMMLDWLNKSRAEIKRIENPALAGTVGGRRAK